ncbi:MAG: hypothetical protein SGI91_08980 [Alphaproteobacteria bacterium]|mgnify:CR=1 FL=1|nr:hypothetical protein [Alphaproteobacteria bacterium]
MGNGSADISRRLVMAAGGALLTLPAATIAFAADAPVALHANLGDLKRFIGRWAGEGEGQPGKSTVERTYEATLGGRFILARHRSSYAPQEKNPKGEVHDDVGYFSFDKARKRFVFRQFHVEGFVNQFVAATPSFDKDTLVFDSEAIENIPAGWRARETYKFSGTDAFEEIFELSEPSKDFTVYSHNRFKRA